MAVCQICRLRHVDPDHVDQTAIRRAPSVQRESAHDCAQAVRRWPPRARARPRSPPGSGAPGATAQTMPLIQATATTRSDGGDGRYRSRRAASSDGLGVGQHDQAAGRDTEDAGGEVLDQPGGDRGGDDAAGQQGDGVGPLDALASRAPRRKPSEPPTATTNSEVSIEPTTLRGSRRPDGEQRGGADRAPAAATDGVERAADEAHRAPGSSCRGRALKVGRRPPRTRKR